jgi:hypothetical protein
MGKKANNPNSLRAKAARANGAKSKGPKTDAGREQSSQNALKHGLTALKWAGKAGDEAAFLEFSEAVTAAYKPEGIHQEVLVERIVNCMWRLRRIPQIEASLESSYVDENDPNRIQHQRLIEWPHQRLALSRYEANIHRCMHKDMKELKALQEEAAFEAQEKERERIWMEALNAERRELVTEELDSHISQLVTRNSQFPTLPNEPNQVQNRLEIKDLEGLDPELLKAIQELTDPSA